MNWTSYLTPEFKEAIFLGNAGRIWLSGDVMVSLVEQGTNKLLATTPLRNPYITGEGETATLDADDAVIEPSADVIGRRFWAIKLHTEQMTLAWLELMVPEPPTKIDSTKVIIRWDNGPKKIARISP